MKVIEIQQESELQALRTAWNGLLASAVSNTVFLTWEWVTAWWSTYGKPGELRVLLAADDAGAIVGIAPLRPAYLDTARRFPLFRLWGPFRRFGLYHRFRSRDTGDGRSARTGAGFNAGGGTGSQ